mgnify:CR=1 FL=1
MRIALAFLERNKMADIVILQDTTWSGTVNLDGTVQVGEGVKLTVAKGTTINGGRIEVWGSLIVNGQSNSRINLNSVDIAIGSKYQQTPGTIDIQYATINEGSLFTNNGYGAYNLKDSIYTTEFDQPHHFLLVLEDLNIPLSIDEAKKIQFSFLKRPATLTELVLFSIQGSEHSSYKSSKNHIKHFITI